MTERAVKSTLPYASIARLAGMAIMAFAGMALLGWAMNVAMLRGVGLDVGEINVGTATGFALAGLALWLYQSPASPRMRLAARCCAGGMLLIGAAMLALYIGEALGLPYAPLPSGQRMSPLTAINFVLIGTGLVLSPRDHAARLMQSAVLAALLITVQVLIGYTYNVPFNGLDNYTPMSVQSALLFLVLCAGALFLRGDDGLMARVTNPGPGGMLVRTLLLATIAVPMALGWLRLLIEHTGIVDPRVAVALQSTANIAIFLLLALRSARLVYRLDRHRHEIEQRTSEIAATNRRLEAEIHERQQAEAALRFLAQASAVLGASLDEPELLQRFARLAVAEVVDGCAIDVLHATGTLERSAVAFRTAAVETVLAELNIDEFIAAALHENHLPAIMRQPATTDDSAASGSEARLSCMIVPLRTRDQLLGALIWVRGGAGAFGGSELALAEDLGHRVAQAIDNARLYNAAQEAARLREEFLGIAAHELKTPLSALLGNTFLLQRWIASTPGASERDARVVNAISEQGWRLEKLIGALLDVSRIELGRFAIDPQPLELVALIKRVVAEQERTEAHTIFVQCAATPIMITGDELRLEQVLRNVLQNAIKYSPQGGAIFVRVTEEQAQVAIAVTDHGIGIPQSAQPHLFNRFYRARNTEALRVTGMGIGLYVVKEIVQQHGGSIDLRSAEGRGSTFTIRLPYQPTLPSLPDPASEAMSSST